ncbi:MAG: YgiQ family radical SAM protein [Bacteroidales bacterium]
MTNNRLNDKKQWLPTTKKEVELLGWDYIDVILFSGDAYIDHPSMGSAVIGRVLERAGYRVAIIPQPNWQDDLRDFRKLGAPRLFFGVSAGAMDSMVNHYTAARRRRSDDAYTPDARHGMRPDYPTIVYTDAIRAQYPDTPIIIGGIEASLRRLSHYDYWQDKLRPSILADCKADMLIYGMGEKPILEIAQALSDGKSISELTDIKQTTIKQPISALPTTRDTAEHYILNSFTDCLKDKRKQAENFKYIEIESNRTLGRTLWQETENGVAIKVNGTNPPLSESELDAVYDLPYTRLPHPKYRNKRIPAYEMIRHSVTLHRGCFGGCSFCTISAHQGKFISSRSKESILREVRKVIAMEDFKGHISDLGGPSANMYKLGGINRDICTKCTKPSCLHPTVCKNLDTNHTPLLEIYRAVDAIPSVKKSFIGSGVRYDLSMSSYDEKSRTANRIYNEELIRNHVSGRLKVAPEHTSDKVLNCMRKPSFKLFEEFKQLFDNINKKHEINQQLIPYFISSHPECSEMDMAELATKTKELNFHLEQVQDFTPTPMTLSTEIYYSGYHPYTFKPISTAKEKDEKLAQRRYFFWYSPDYRAEIVQSLTRMNRHDLISKLYPNRGNKDKNNSKQENSKSKEFRRNNSNSKKINKKPTKKY